MKTIKTIFAILFLTTMFMSCETDTLNDEVGFEEVDTFGEDGADETSPGNE